MSTPEQKPDLEGQKKAQERVNQTVVDKKQNEAQQHEFQPSKTTGAMLWDAQEAAQKRLAVEAAKQKAAQAKANEEKPAIPSGTLLASREKAAKAKPDPDPETLAKHAREAQLAMKKALAAQYGRPAHSEIATAKKEDTLGMRKK